MSQRATRISRRQALGTAAAVTAAALLPRPAASAAAVVSGTVEHAGARIYYEVEGAGPALVLHHGLGGSLGDWRAAGYVSALRSSHRLILLDARGHGRSTRPRDEAAYAAEHRVGDVRAVLDALGIERASLWGFSMGGMVALAFAAVEPERVDRLVIGGAGVVDLPAEAYALAGRAAALPELAAQHFNLNATALLARLRPALDVAAEEAARQSLPGLQIARLIREAPDPASIGRPALLYAGDRDPLAVAATATAARMPRALLHLLRGLDHIETFLRADLALPLARAFLSPESSV